MTEAGCSKRQTQQTAGVRVSSDRWW